MTAPDLYLLYIPCRNVSEAQSLATVLLKSKLIACANIQKEVLSMYEWEGQISVEPEALIMAKTMKKNINSAIAKVEELHSYDCPCVTSLPITSCNSKYLNWVEGQLS